MARVYVGARVRVHVKYEPLGQYEGVVTKHVGPRVWAVKRVEDGALNGHVEKVWRGDIVDVLPSQAPGSTEGTR